MQKSRHIVLENEILRMVIDSLRGNVIEAYDKTTGFDCVKPYTVFSIFSSKPQQVGGLDILVRCGKEHDRNTGVLIPSSAIQNAERSFRKMKDRVIFKSSDNSLTLEIKYILPAGREPLTVCVTLQGKKTVKEKHQLVSCCKRNMEGDWKDMVCDIDGMGGKYIQPYGKFVYGIGNAKSEIAAFWKISSFNGFVLQNVSGVKNFFVQMQKPGLCYGPMRIRTVSVQSKPSRSKPLCMQYKIYPL